MVYTDLGKNTKKKNVTSVVFSRTGEGGGKRPHLRILATQGIFSSSHWVVKYWILILYNTSMGMHLRWLTRLPGWIDPWLPAISNVFRLHFHWRGSLPGLHLKSWFCRAGSVWSGFSSGIARSSKQGNQICVGSKTAAADGPHAAAHLVWRLSGEEDEYDVSKENEDSEDSEEEEYEESVARKMKKQSS